MVGDVIQWKGVYTRGNTWDKNFWYFDSTPHRRKFTDDRSLSPGLLIFPVIEDVLMI